MAKKKGSKKEPLLKVTEEEAVELKQAEEEDVKPLITERVVEYAKELETQFIATAPRAPFVSAEKISFDFPYTCYHKTPGHCKECYAKARK